jgi:hypothetical protein
VYQSGHSYPTQIARNVGKGQPFINAAIGGVNASSDLTSHAMPFYVLYSGGASVFNATRMFMMF